MLGINNAGAEIDIATGAALLSELRDMVDDSNEAIVTVDCSGITFMDSAAFHALLEASTYAARRGHTLVIHDLSPSCARLINLCDFERELRVAP